MAFSKDLPTSLVATAPSPAISGTTLVVTAGEGALFDTPSFYATIAPANVAPTMANSEIVLVTAISTDTFTITRAQKSTTAQTVLVGWRISRGVYASDLAGFAPIASPTFTGTVSGITPAMVGAPSGSGTSTGTNTGDETLATIKTKLGITTLSGSNTGDQTTVTGNAGTATTLQTARTIGTATGDVTSAGSTFNGGANNTNALTLATVNSNVGSFGSATQVPTYTVNAKGLTTAAANVAIQIAESQVTNLTTDLAGKISSSTTAKLTTGTTAPSSPATGDIWVDTTSLPENLAPSSIVWKEIPGGTVNGTNTAFTTAQTYVSGTLQVFVNGVAQSSLLTEVSPTAGTFSISPAPLTGDNLNVQYQVRVTGTGNASTVTGYTANATPTANNIPVLDGNALMPAASLGGVWNTWTPTISTTSGAFGSASATGRYTTIGKTVMYQATITITSVGSATNTIFTLPVTAQSATTVMVGYGREDNANGYMLEAKVNTSTTATVFYYNNTNPTANGLRLLINGSYESA